MTSNIKKFVCLPLLIAIIAVCSNEDTETGKIVLHPIEQNIPFYDNEHIAIDTIRSVKKTKIYNDNIDLLNSYLKDQRDYTLKKLNVLTSNEIDIISVGETRFFILDTDNDRLIEYNLTTDSVTVVAEQGRGPGEIMHTSEITKKNNRAYIGMKDGKIALFNCEKKPCSFLKVIKLGLSPHSLAVQGGDSLAVLSYASRLGSNGVKSEKGLVDKAVKVFDKNQNKVGGFGDAYNTEGHWMLLRPLVGEGMIRYSHGQDLFILTYKRFPFLYVYGGDYELEDTYELSPFILGHQKYWPTEGRRRIVMEDHSIINKVSMIDENRVFVQTKTKTNRRADEGRWKWDQLIRCYLLDLSDGQKYYLGSKRIDGNSSIHFTEQGLLLNRDGSLFLMKQVKVIPNGKK